MADPKKILLIGMGMELGQAGVLALKANIEKDFPNHEVRIITGMVFAGEFEGEPVAAPKTEKPSGAYL